MSLILTGVQSFLSSQFHSEITNLHPVGQQGEWSRAYFFTLDGTDKVARFSSLDEDFRKDIFSSRFSSPNMPIPPIEVFGEAFGGYFTVSPRVEGVMFEDLSADEMRKSLPALMDLLLALREADTSGTRGFGGFDVHGIAAGSSWLEALSRVTIDSPASRITGWKQKLAARPETDEVFNLAYHQFLDLLHYCPEERCLIHNDLLHFNLIMRDHKVAAVIDWGCALYGDSLYDLAMFTTWQFYYPAMAGIDFVQEAKRHFAQKGIVLPHLEERLKCYQLHLLLDNLTYNAYKENWESIDLVTNRLKAIL